jgi:excisionase family DNA binding protein
MPEKAEPRRRLVSPTDGAKYYGVSLRTFRTIIARGAIRAYRIPGSVRLVVDLDELDAALCPIPTVGTLLTGSQPVGAGRAFPLAAAHSSRNAGRRASQMPDEAA